MKEQGGAEKAMRENMKQEFDELLDEYRKVVKFRPRFWVKYIIGNILYRCATTFMLMLTMVYVRIGSLRPFVPAVGLTIFVYFLCLKMLRTRLKRNPYRSFITFFFLLSLLLLMVMAVSSLYRLYPNILEFSESHFSIIMGFFAILFFFVTGPNKERFRDIICIRMLQREMHLMRMSPEQEVSNES